MTQDVRYRRIEGLVKQILAAPTPDSSLPALGSAVQLSPGHLQREFADFTGLSPQQFAQVLTRSALERRLRSDAPLLHIAEASAMSSVSRLHDLCVQMDAMTPQDCRRQGQGVRIFGGSALTPLGWAELGWTDRGLCHLQFTDAPQDRDCTLAAIREAWPEAQIHADAAGAEQLAASVFSGALGKGLRVLVRGTRFQVKVWQALMAIPPGRLRSYQDVAEAVGLPRAARAVGTAVGRNPLAILIPCHRVIRADGRLGGYRWGLARKALILAAENGAQCTSVRATAESGSTWQVATP